MDKVLTFLSAEHNSAQSGLPVKYNAGRLVLLCKSERSGDPAWWGQKDERQNRSETPDNQRDKVTAETIEYNIGLCIFGIFTDNHKIIYINICYFVK